MASTYIQRLRLFSRDTWLYLLSAGAVGFAYYGVSGVLLNLYLLRLGYGPEFVGLLFAAGALCWALAALPAGIIGRRWGVRRSIILGMTVVALGMALPPCAEFIPQAWRPAWLVATNALGWAGGALYWANGTPFLAGACGDEERGHAFSVNYALFPLAGFAGALVAGRLPALFGGLLDVSLDAPAPFRYALWLGAVCYIPGLAALFATRKRTFLHTTEAEREAGLAPWRLIAVLGLVSLLQMAAIGALQSFFNVYLDADLHLTTARIGTLMAAGQLLGGAASLAAPILMAHYGKPRTFTLACLGIGFCILPLALVPHWIAAGVGFVGLSAMASVAGPTLNVFGQESVSPRWRPAVSGACTMAMGLSMALVGLSGGRAVTALGFGIFFLLSGALPVAAAVLFWAYFRVLRGEAAIAPVPEAGGEGI